jgi:proliferating cell nuclear antigen PCNA
VTIECSKDGVKFFAAGDIGQGSITLRQHTDVEKPENNVEISLGDPVALTFSLKYLINFTKATNLSSSVNICLSNDVPLLIDYTVSTNSYLRFYLAPKVFTSRYPTVLKLTNSGSRLGTMSEESEVAPCYQIERSERGQSRNPV